MKWAALNALVLNRAKNIFLMGAGRTGLNDESLAMRFNAFGV